MKYVVISDIHAHRWSLFSEVGKNGVNTRLQIILDEMLRAAQTLIDQGGQHMIIAGDIFHVRGSIDPEVLNPVQQTIRAIMDMGVRIFAIPGNHDLSSKETTSLGSSVQTLSETFSELGGFYVENEPAFDSIAKFAFVPWISNTETLLKEIDQLGDRMHRAGEDVQHFDLFIHAGIDDVLPNMPAHGLTASKLADLGFGRVFAGHYHNHKDLGHGVYSIGATTHQTWGDVGSRAGFLMVDDKSVAFHDSRAPKFIDVSGMSEEDMVLTVPGNYVRFRGEAMTLDQIRELREFLSDNDAKGVSIQVTRSVVNARKSGGSGATMLSSIEAYIDDASSFTAAIDRAALKVDCVTLINDVTSASAV